MAEDHLWKWLSGLVPKGHYNRIESPETAPGFPDVHYQLSGTHISGTLELKDARFPRRVPPFKNEDDGLHATQIHWMLTNNYCGGICWIVARVQPKVFWIPSKYAIKFNGCLQLERIATYVLRGKLITAKDVVAIREMMRGGDLEKL